MSEEIKNPLFLSCSIGEKADEGTINNIPQKRTSGLDYWRGTVEDGFPLITMTPKIAGGEPPEGQDFNGFLRLLSSHADFQQQGGLYTFNQEWSDANNGYPLGAILWYIPKNSAPYQIKSLIPNNTFNFVENPDYMDNIHWTTATTLRTGSIFIWAGDTAPTYSMVCNGAEISKFDYTALYSIIRNKFGTVEDSNRYYCYLYGLKNFYIINDTFEENLDVYDKANKNSKIGKSYMNLNFNVGELTEKQNAYFKIESTGITHDFYGYTFEYNTYYTQVEMIEVEGIDYDTYNDSQEEIVGVSSYREVDGILGFYLTMDDGETYIPLDRNSDYDTSYREYKDIENTLYYIYNTLDEEGVPLLNNYNKKADNVIGLAYIRKVSLFAKPNDDKDYYELTRYSDGDSDYDDSLFKIPNLQTDGFPCLFCIYV